MLLRSARLSCGWSRLRSSPVSNSRWLWEMGKLSKCLEITVFEPSTGRSLRLVGREERGEHRVHEGFMSVMKVCVEGG